jgi:cell shape-determining protein MreC
MKSPKELEVEAYLAGATVVAQMYAFHEDAILDERILYAKLENKNEDLKQQLEDLFEDLDEAYRENFELRGRLEEIEWRMEQLEK